MNSLSLEENTILSGVDQTPGIIAVEPYGDSAMRLFIRAGDGLVVREEPFTPFLLLEEESLLKGFRIPFTQERLTGGNAFKILVFFQRWGDCLKARDHLRRSSGGMATSPRAPYLFVSDPVHQHLLLTGKTLFGGLAYTDLHRLALDIETVSSEGFEFSNPRRPEDRIISIALRDNRGYSEILFGRDMDEGAMIEALTDRINRLDPDVLEGHNLFNFDLEYISTRARRLGVSLTWGRNGSEPRTRPSRFTVAERVLDFTRMDIYGRHIVDTLFLVQYYDVSARELESYGLKAVALHFGLSDASRTLIDHSRIRWYYDNDPESLKHYNMDDARETLALSELLGYPFFLQARMFPFSYQNIFIRGNATKINALFLREYLRQRTSIPRPSGRSELEGGYTDVFLQGVYNNVIHCDVASLYPSILLSYGLKPSGDSLDIFLPLLRNLRTFRLEAKRRALIASRPQEKDYYQALQQTFKILINSFYGYLGTELHNFSDPGVASEVTRRGREIIRQMLEWLQRQGATPIEIDTDGIYFLPPQGCNDKADAAKLVGDLSSTLPQGIDVEMDGRYRAMFSYKMKNYALLEENGIMIIRGSGLKSRGMEKYLRSFLSEMIRRLLEGRPHEIHELYRETLRRLEAHQIPIADLARTETLTESPESYKEKVAAKKRNRAATYELALKSGRELRAGDQVSYYVTGEGKKVRVFENCSVLSGYDPHRPNENIEYYEAKLLELLKKFKEFLPGPSLYGMR